MKKFLLTGGVGYVGSHTAVALLEAGCEVVLLDNLANSSATFTEQIGKITGRTPKLVVGDVRDTALVTDILKSEGCEAVLHFAGLKAVGESVAQPISYYACNVSGTISLLQAMEAASVKSLVFSSSATVYGLPQHLPISEEHPTSATNPYGRTKLHIEEILADVVRADPSWRIACLRYFNPAGAHESGFIGENPRGIPNNLVPYIVKVAAGALPQLRIFGGDYPTEDGTGVRDYIHVMDVAQGHLSALGYLAKKTGWCAFNLGTGRGHSVLEILREFEQVSGKKVPYEIVERRPGDVAVCFAESVKANQLLHWSADRNLQDICTTAWKWHVRHSSEPS